MALFDVVGKFIRSESHDLLDKRNDGPQPGRRTLVNTDPEPGAQVALRPPTPGEPSEVTNARTLLARRDLDAAHQLELIRRVLEVAAYSSPATAELLLLLVAPFGAQYSGVANIVALRLAELAHQKKPAATTTAPPSAIPSSIPTTTTATSTPTPLLAAGFDWTTLIVHDKTGTHASTTISPADQSQLTTIAAGRKARLAAERTRIGSRLGSRNWVPYLGDHGWQDSGDPKAASY